MPMTHTAALLAASALTLVLPPPAAAQTNTAPTIPAPGATGTAPAAMDGTRFIQAREPGQYRASELIGGGVYGADGARIGDINDVLVDGRGQVAAVVLGVGGFLGIGEKSVAVPMQALRFEADAPGGGAGPAITVPPLTSNPVAPVAPGAGPAIVPPAGTTGTAETARARRATPDRIVVQLTRQQLEQAPAFRDDARRAAAGAGAGTTGAAPDGAAGNPPSTAVGRAIDRAQGDPIRPDGTPGNPPGTVVGRAIDRALGTDTTGANPGGAGGTR